MNRKILATAGLLALLAPAAAFAKSDGAGTKGKGKSKPRSYVFKGTVTGVDAAASDVTVEVRKGNRAARRFVGQALTFDVASARLEVADVDADGTVGASDVRAGDRVVVHVRAPRDVAAGAPLSARKLVDRTSPPEDEAAEPVEPAEPVEG